MTTTVSNEPTIRLTLRDYQADAIDRTLKAEARGARRQLGVAATGLGKTIIFCALAAQRGGRALILAHRDELVSQAAAKVREVWPDVTVGIVKAGDNDVHAHVVVASVQTLARQSRLDKLIAAYENGGSLLRPCDPFDLVVVDEAHHTAAESYRRILDALRAGHPADPVPDDPEFDVDPRPAGPLLLGVTATPDRGDGKGLDDLFDEITWTYDILWGIRSGYLSDVRGLRVAVDNLDMGDVKVSRGDYDAGSAGRAMEHADAHVFVAHAWKAHATGRRTLLFTPTVEMARLCAVELRKVGARAAMVSGATPLDERRATLRAYANGGLDVLANCAVLTEGYDEPRTDCVIVARPTKSRALYTQMVGRGTRRHPDKTDLLVLDVVGASIEHSLVTIPSLFGLEREQAERMGDGTQNLTDAVADHEQQLVKLGRLRAEEADLFAKVRSTGIAWVRVNADRYERPLGRARQTCVLVNRQHSDEGWLCGIVEPDGAKRVLIADVTLEMAQGVGEDFLRKAAARTGSALANVDAPWRKRAPSARQAMFARRLGIIPGGFKTAGELADAIDLAMSTRPRRRKK